MKINYLAPEDHTGYGVAAAQYTRVLRSLGHDVAFQPLRPGGEPGLWYQCAPVGPLHSPRLHPDADTILHIVPEYYPVLAAWLRQRGIAGRIFGMTAWETDALPGHWPQLLNPLSAVLVPSEWNRTVFRRSHVTAPIHCVPHISEFQGVPSQKIARIAELEALEGKFVFLSIAAQVYRKGNDLLIDAFRRAFPARQDVVLVLKTSAEDLQNSTALWGRFIQHRWWGNRLLSKAASDPRLLVITGELTPAEMQALHLRCDCYASCTRGEGWGMGMYEAILFGKPVLAPSLGGHLDFMPGSSPNLVQSRLVRVPRSARNGSYTADQRWVETDVNAMADRMQKIVADPAAALQNAALLAQAMRARFTPESIAGQLTRALEFGRSGPPSYPVSANAGRRTRGLSQEVPA